MQLSWEKYDRVINRKLILNQLLLYVSIGVALILFLVQRENVLWSIYFIALGALALPNINRCKEDRKLFKENALHEAKGKVLDLFPEKDGGENWIIFLEEEHNEDLKEFMLYGNPGIEAGSEVIIRFTPKMNIPISVTPLETA